jgi:CMP-N-acetylneuraminic acid synthetase
VPIKLKNERLPYKNTKILAGKPLINHILNTLIKVKSIEEIFVYCSDEAIVPFLPKEVTFLKRNSVLDLPTSNFSQILDAFIETIKADVYVYVHATAPFLTNISIEDCLENVKNGQFDSAFTAVKIQDYLWQSGKPLNFNVTNIPRSQDLEPIYRETSGCYVLNYEQYTKTHRRVGNNPYIREVSFREAVDINTPEDFQLAELLI